MVLYGTMIHSISVKDVEVIQDGLMVVGLDGKIAVFLKNIAPTTISGILSQHGFSASALPHPVRVLSRGQFICPGFIDTHNHAPQWTQRGTGRGRLIMDWLNSITFPHEARFADPVYARKTYASCVEGFIKQGITTASYYGSLHGEATKILANVCFEKGQRALVGKCNMNTNCPDFYCDANAKISLEVTEDFIAHVRQLDPQGELVKAILTPRFAVACDADVLSGLGHIAAKNPDLAIQTHFDETLQEMEITKEMYPEFANEADLYQHFGLLNSRSILAHCIYVDDYDMGRLEALDCGVAHCPVSNMTSGQFGAAPIRQYLRRGMKVGLGTDSGGGFSSSIMDAMRAAFVVSKAKEIETDGADECLTLHEAFYLATLGGARVCGIEDKVGNWALGKEFDGLVVDAVGEQYKGVMTPIEDIDTVDDIFEKFIMSGDDRNIAEVYVKGSRK